MKDAQFREIKDLIIRLTSREGSFYQKKYADIDVEAIKSPEDFAQASVYQQG